VKEGRYKTFCDRREFGDFLGVIKFRDTLANEKSESPGHRLGLDRSWRARSSLPSYGGRRQGKLTPDRKLARHQESAQAAMSYVRSRAAQQGVPQASSVAPARSAPHQKYFLAITRKIDSAESKHPSLRLQTGSRPPALQPESPDMVTSRTSTPRSEPSLASSCEVSGYTVLMSMTREPRCALANAPSGPL